jgi:DNA-binding transcriptional LysR family regulator
MAELLRAEQGAAADAQTPRGLLTLTAPVLFGRLKLRPVLDRFLDANPEVQARLILLDRVVSLLDEGIDVAARLADLPDSSLQSTHLGNVRRVLCASPAYLERHGWPKTPADLLDHVCIMSNEPAAEPWSFADGSGRRRALRTVSIRPRLIVNAASAAIDSALDGHGITRVMSYQVAAAVAEGRLVMQADRAMTAKLRAFIDFAAPLLRRELMCEQIGPSLDREPCRSS